MKLMNLILAAMFITAIMPVALSQGSYLSPTMGQMYPTDWLEGGSVRNIDRSMLMDPGIAGMVRWLDSPVPSFSWYSSDASFYRQMMPASTFSPFSEYYATAAVPIEGEIISNPARFDIVKATPSNVYYGAGQGLPYSQYLSIVPSRTNDLWIRGTRNWTQYLVSPVGMTLELVANVPVGGMGSFYETVQTETTSLRSKTYQFNAGYNTMKFNANQLGRHILYFIVDNQPSNVVIVDVFAQAPQVPSPIYPLPGLVDSLQYLSPSQMPTPAPSSGDVPVTIIYPNPGNYEVYVDGAYVGTGSNGDFTFHTRGGMSHVISIWDGFWMYQKSIYFESELPKIINVEAI